MTSFPSTLKNVFGGRAGARPQSVQTVHKPWNPFRLVPTSHPAAAPADLQEMVEGQVIPSLLRSHPVARLIRDASVEPAFAANDLLDANAVKDFARFLLARRAESLGAFIDSLRTRGLDPERLYSDLLAPAAQLLADLWDEDEISSTEVTIGLSRLHHLVRDLDIATAYNGESDISARSCLFSPRAGEQQTFGFYMVEELFRWSGWRTWIETAGIDADMVADARGNWFDMFCLSVSRSSDIEAVGVTIDKVRRASRNRDLFVMVSGRPFVERPELVENVGANAVASAGREALNVADRWVRHLATA
jgi:methanogenic corrinoid protein MtbC1